MATVIMVTDKVLTPEEAEARQRRVAAIIRDIENELISEEEAKMKERGTNEQFATDI